MKFAKPTEAKTMRTIVATYDPMKEWRLDPKGYFLIRIHDGKLEIGLCKRDNSIEVKIIGTTPEEIYNTVIREKITLEPTHVAYLGKELEKAFTALKLGIPYIQDDPLDLSAVRIKLDHE